MADRSIKPVWLFVALFAISLVIQTAILLRSPIYDDSQWIRAIKETSEHTFLHPHESNIFGYPYGYPGIPILFGGAVLHTLRVTDYIALRIPLILFDSLGIAIIGLLAFLIRPQSLWWAGVTAVLLFESFPYFATAPTLLVQPFIVIIVLLTLWISETEVNEKRFKRIALLALANGVALSMRFDIALYVSTLSFFFLLYKIGRYAWLLPLLTIPAAICCNPYLWAHPFEFIQGTLDRIRASYESFPAAATISVVFTTSISAIVAMCAAAYLLISPRGLAPISRSFIVWLFSMTALLFGILFASPTFHPVWYFYSPLVVWNAFLPLFLLALVPPISKYIPQPFAVRAPLLLTVGISLAKLVDLIQFYSRLP